MLALAWCYSIKSDVSLALRQNGILAKMVIEHDLRQICKNPNTKLDKKQSEIIENVVNEKPQNVILWGSSGTGKTILLTQALGMKFSYFKKENILIFDQIVMRYTIPSPPQERGYRGHSPLTQEFIDRRGIFVN